MGYAGPFAGEFRQHFEKLWLNTEEQTRNARSVAFVGSCWLPLSSD